MSYKTIPKKMRMNIYEKCNHRCAFCGCNLEYEDMQVDNIDLTYTDTGTGQKTTQDEFISEENMLPSCRQCNLYKSTMSLEHFRIRISTTLWNNLKKNFNYEMALKYGLIKENKSPQIVFYFETLDK